LPPPFLITVSFSQRSPSFSSSISIQQFRNQQYLLTNYMKPGIHPPIRPSLNIHGIIIILSPQLKDQSYQSIILEFIQLKNTW
ncbi:MAG: hypothetical protein ACLVJ6_15755, partial [Merdibacter sp.]